MQLITALLVYNEAGNDRYLGRVLNRCRQFSDTIVVLDDQSTDGTPKLCEDYGCVVERRSGSDPRAWGSEATAREQLWNLALTHATGWDDWIFIVDADHEVIGDVRSLCLSWETNAWNFVLYDMWGEKEYRSDGHWQAHTLPRPWLFSPHRVPKDWQPQWGTRGIHTGHFPSNMPLISGLAPPEDFRILHWSYAKPEHRIAKHRQYLSQSHQLTPFERAHVESILS